jgi:hypothetical protein
VVGAHPAASPTASQSVLSRRGRRRRATCSETRRRSRPRRSERSLLFCRQYEWTSNRSSINERRLESNGVRVCIPSPERPRLPLDFHRFRVLGFPDGQRDGVWSTGRIRGEQGTRWFQLQSDPGDQAIVPGFSGSPVWDEESGAVVGMTVAVDSSADTTTAYLIPIDQVLGLDGALGVAVRADECTDRRSCASTSRRWRPRLRRTYSWSAAETSAARAGSHCCAAASAVPRRSPPESWSAPTDQLAGGSRSGT